MALNITELEGAAFGDTVSAEGKTLKFQEITAGNVSNAFGKRTQLVRLEPEEDVRIAIGEDPTAVSTDEKLLADRTYHKAVTPGHKISVITA
ncbi:MAG: hypothetical protein CL561_00310 [Alphaproteobacteria bacterium]|nr:hypothetical protein [Alphaproteobacteria bacterium]|tara:strand:+ start:6508 stop:6783 length:276 start_codon:yes stop_codon:yes gene_type:complete